MKYLVGAIVSAVVVTMPMQAVAGVWNFEERFADRPEITHDEIVKALYNAIEAWSRSTTNPMPRELNQALAAIYEPPAVQITFRTVQENDSERTVLASGTMYYAKGDLFVINDPSDSQASEDVESLSTQMPNFVTLNGNLYSWDVGSTEGSMLTRFPGDTVELIDYLIDPAMLMRYTYLDYAQSPDEFTVTELNGQIDIRRNEILYGYAGIRVMQSPFWMAGNVVYRCITEEDCDEIELEGDRLVMEYDPPIPLEALPEEIQRLPEGVTFTPSESTVDKFLVYL